MLDFDTIANITASEQFTLQYMIDEKNIESKKCYNDKSKMKINVYRVTFCCTKQHCYKEYGVLNRTLFKNNVLGLYKALCN